MEPKDCCKGDVVVVNRRAACIIEVHKGQLALRDSKGNIFYAPCSAAKLVKKTYGGHPR